MQRIAANGIYVHMRPASKTVFIAALCAMAVLWVLITPAFDELPSTLPHHFHFAALPALPVASQAQTLELAALPGIDPSQWFGGSRLLLALTCTRLC